MDVEIAGGGGGEEDEGEEERLFSNGGCFVVLLDVHDRSMLFIQTSLAFLLAQLELVFHVDVKQPLSTPTSSHSLFLIHRRTAQPQPE